ncbi:MAG TPA: hypothetical protein VK734_16930 [Bradyrhizobium sp.]|jgi:hypothetical protein|nr:hypothetical protein [Bradyrhizobium sp.]
MSKAISKSVFAAIALLFAAIPFAATPAHAADTDRALLSTFCAPGDIQGSTCKRAKGYPNAPRGGCEVTLNEDRYSGRFLPSGNPLLVVNYESGCEAHATDNGGSVVFEQSGGTSVFRGFAPGAQVDDCVTPAKDEQQNFLVCLGGHIAQGVQASWVALMQFKPDASGRIGITPDVLVNAEDGTGAYGTNIVTCKDRFKFFEVSKLAAGPRPATVIVDTTYADADLIATVCRKGYPKPEEATGWLAQGDAYVPTGREKTGKFVIDLVTRKIAPQ